MSFQAGYSYERDNVKVYNWAKVHGQSKSNHFRNQGHITTQTNSERKGIFTPMGTLFFALLAFPLSPGMSLSLFPDGLNHYLWPKKYCTSKIFNKYKNLIASCAPNSLSLNQFF